MKAGSSDLATDKASGELGTVALLDGAMPIGVSVSRGGRIFDFSGWGDDVMFTVADLEGGEPGRRRP